MRWVSCCCLVLVLRFPVAGGAAAGPRVGIRFTDSVLSQRFTGRVFLAASRQPIPEGVFRQGWFTPEPFFAQDVKDWKPGEEMPFEPTHHFPQRWTKLAPGKYYLQAVMDRDLGGQSPFASPGNAYSKAVL